MIVSVAGGRSDDATRSGMRIVGEGLDLASLDALVGADRPVYRHSVVAGGVYTPDELRDVLVQDAIAATHYQGLNQNAIRTETLKQDRFAYVSYRKNDQIFWTRNKVKLSEGETVLTDGNKEIRARCGNCISETPQLPVAEVEPASVEFDQLVDDSGDPFLSAAIRSALESPSFSSGGGSRRPSVVGGGSAAGASSADAGSSALLPSGSIGGGGGVGPTSLASRPTTLASRGPSVGDGAAGSPAGPEGQPGGSLSSPGSSSTGDPDSSTAYPPSVTSSTDGAADPSGPMSSAPLPQAPFPQAPFPQISSGAPGTRCVDSTWHRPTARIRSRCRSSSVCSEASFFNRWSTGWIRGRSRRSIPAGAGHAASPGRGCRRRGPAKASQPSLSAVRSPACRTGVRTPRPSFGSKAVRSTASQSFLHLAWRIGPREHLSLRLDFCDS